MDKLVTLEVPSAEVRQILSGHQAAVDQLFQFGAFMMREVQQRSSQLEAKAANAITWGVALAATAAFDLKEISIWDAVKVVALLAGLVGIILAIISARLQVWASPSEADWFKVQIVNDEDLLRRYHVESLHHTHQNQNRLNNIKAARLGWSQRWLLTGCLLMLAAQLGYVVSRGISRFFS